MAPIRQISDRQLEMIVEFAEANRAIVLGNGGKGPLGQKEANKAWEELARRLNSIGGGVIKTPNNWKRVSSFCLLLSFVVQYCKCQI